MVAKAFEIGDLVWAQMKGYPHWPAKIVDPSPEKTKTPVKKNYHFVYFFGSKNYSWILDEKIVHHSEEMLDIALKKKYKGYKEGVEELISQSKLSLKKSKSPSKMTNGESSETISPKRKADKTVNKVVEPKDGPLDKELVGQPKKVTSAKQRNNKPLKKRRSLNENDEDVFHTEKGSQSKTITPGKKPNDNSQKKHLSLSDEDLGDSESDSQSEKESPAKQPKNKAPTKHHSLSETDEDCPPSQVISSDDDASDSYSMLFASVLPSIGAEPLLHTIPSEPTNMIGLKRDLRKNMDELVRLRASDLRIGFLGMGMMGRSMVQNLIDSGHNVTIWNRTPEKCDDLVSLGATQAETPADVVRASDITFSCLSDPHAVRTVVFGEHGVLKGIEGYKRGEKGYVEMSSIDAETSQEIAEAITNVEMRYLEAPIIGSANKAENGSVCILGSGDRALFNDCESCFHAISNHAYYISCDVGKSANINIITSMFLGTMYVALAETLALTEKVQLSQSDIMEILEMRGISCPALADKGAAILEKDFTVDTALKHQQKDINLALKLSDMHDQPMPVTAAANEVYKHAKLLGFADYDAAAVYQGAKH